MKPYTDEERIEFINDIKEKIAILKLSLRKELTTRKNAGVNKINKK